MPRKKRNKSKRSQSHFFSFSFVFLLLLILSAYVLHHFFRSDNSDSLIQVSAPTAYKENILGIDISHHNGRIDWDKVKASGVSFAYIKVSEGTTHLNRRFTHNYQQAKEARLKCGMYHFFSYNKSGKEQALYFLENLTFEDGDLPPAVDIEYSKSSDRKTDPKIVQQRKKDIVSFDSVIYDALGVHPIIYTNAECYRDLIKGTLPDASDLWICDIIHEKPTINRPWSLWQYKHDGKISGIKGNVDLNIFNGNDSVFRAWIDSYR